MVASLYLNALLVTIVQVVVLFIVGKFAFHVELPHNMAPVVLAVVVGSACFTALGIGASTLVPNEDAAGPMISIVYFVLLFLSGLWFPLKANSALAKISGYFPVRPLIIAMFRPFFLVRGVSPWDWHDLMVIAIWGVGGAILAVRRYKWEPRRNR
jgi:ABC-2 type transport system permease protein